VADFRGGLSGNERDLLYLNTDDSDRFYNVGYSYGVDFSTDGRAFAPVDIDGDGDLDLPVLNLQGLRLLENPSEGTHFTRIRLKATKTHALALGANVVVEDGGVRQQDYVKITAGFQSQVPTDLHFGIRDPADTKIDAIEIRWPSGAVERHEQVPMDRWVLITEGTSTPVVKPLPAWPAESRPTVAGRYDLSATAPVVGGGDAPIAALGKPVVVNFWAPWCEPCKKELPALREVAKRAGDTVQFVGLSVETKDTAGVSAAIAEHRLPYAQLYATTAILESFFGADGEAPLPSTFVFDASGQLRRAFRRAVEVRDLEGLLASLGDEAPHVGHLLVLGEAALKRREVDKAITYLRRALQQDPKSSFVLAQLGVALITGQKTDEGLAHLRRALAVDPKFPYGWYQLGLAYERQDEHDEARKAFQRAVDLRPRDKTYLIQLATAHRRLGDHEPSAALLDTIVALDPTDVTAWLNLGKARLALKRADAAEAFAKVLELEPEHAEAKQLLDAAKTLR